MGFLNGIVLLILGALCIPSLVAHRIRGAKGVLDKLAPFQGVFGFISFLWGIWTVIRCIINLNWLGINLGWAINWITWLINALLCVGGGALLGWGMIQKYLLINASDNVKAKAEKTLIKLTAYQPLIGVVSVAFGLWVIIAAVIW